MAGSLQIFRSPSPSVIRSQITEKISSVNSLGRFGFSGGGVISGSLIYRPSWVHHVPAVVIVSDKTLREYAGADVVKAPLALHPYPSSTIFCIPVPQRHPLRAPPVHH